jgi:hypothetical protein
VSSKKAQPKPAPAAVQPKPESGLYPRFGDAGLTRRQIQICDFQIITRSSYYQSTSRLFIQALLRHATTEQHAAICRGDLPAARGTEVIAHIRHSQ